VPIADENIKIKHSGAATAGGAQSNGDLSLGGYISSSDVGTSLHDLFDSVTGQENKFGGTNEYRCIFVYNTDTTRTWSSVTVNVSNTPTQLSTVIGLGADLNGVQAYNSASAATVSNAYSAPASVSFATTGSVSLGDIPAGSVRALWVRRGIPTDLAGNVVSGVGDSFTLTFSGQSAA